MARLLREADRQGVRRQIKFNNRTKTRSDIASYIIKSKRVRNAEELIAMIPVDSTLPPQITYEDEHTISVDSRISPYIPYENRSMVSIHEQETSRANDSPEGS